MRSSLPATARRCPSTCRRTKSSSASSTLTPTHPSSPADAASWIGKRGRMEVDANERPLLLRRPGGRGAILRRRGRDRHPHRRRGLPGVGPPAPAQGVGDCARVQPVRDGLSAHHRDLINRPLHVAPTGISAIAHVSKSDRERLRRAHAKQQALLYPYRDFIRACKDAGAVRGKEQLRLAVWIQDAGASWKQKPFIKGRKKLATELGKDDRNTQRRLHRFQATGMLTIVPG